MSDTEREAKTFSELETALIDGFHASCKDNDLVYHEGIAETAIRCTALTLIESLSAMPDDLMVKGVRSLASTVPEERKRRGVHPVKQQGKK